MKICKDCDYYIKPTFFGPTDLHMCKRPGCLNEVTGKPEGFCETQRKYDHLCGQDGKHFKPKEEKKKK